MNYGDKNLELIYETEIATIKNVSYDQVVTPEQDAEYMVAVEKPEKKDKPKKETMIFVNLSETNT